MKVLRLGQSLCSSGGGAPETAFVFTVDTTVAGSSGVGKFAMPVTGGISNYDVDWGDGNSDTGQTGTITHTYSSGGVYKIKIDGLLKRFTFSNAGDKDKVRDISNWGIFLGDMSGAFYGCADMTCSATDSITISGTSLANMFRNCTLFNGNVSNWRVSNVTDFKYCFFNCSAFNQPVGDWTTTSLENIKKIFQNAPLVNQNIGGWDITNATDISDVYYSATAITLSSDNLDGIYNGWAAQSVPTGLAVSFGSAKYSAAGSTSRTTLTSAPNNWTITDGGLA